MARNREWKERRSEILAERMTHAKKKLSNAGYKCTTDGLHLYFMYHCEQVRFSPHSGGFTGKSVHNGRGLQNLLNIISNA